MQLGHPEGLMDTLGSSTRPSSHSITTLLRALLRHLTAHSVDLRLVDLELTGSQICKFDLCDLKAEAVGWMRTVCACTLRTPSCDDIQT